MNLPLPVEILVWVVIVVVGGPVAFWLVAAAVALVVALLRGLVIGLACLVSPAYRERRRRAKALARVSKAFADLGKLYHLKAR